MEKIVSFQVHCGGVQSQNYENYVNVQIYMDLTLTVLTFTACCHFRPQLFAIVESEITYFMLCYLQRPGTQCTHQIFE